MTSFIQWRLMCNCNESGFTFSLLVVVAAAPGCHQQPDENWRLQTETTACQKNNLQHNRLNKTYSPMWARSEIFNLSSHPCNPANNETNHPHHLSFTNNIPCKSGIIAMFVCRYLTMHWICAHTYMRIQGCTCIEATLPSPFWRFFSASSNRPGRWITTPLPAW